VFFDILTIFEDFFDSSLKNQNCGVISKAICSGILQVAVRNLRDYTHDRHRTTDDRPFGGGAGMVMKPEPLCNALDEIKLEAQRALAPEPLVVLLSPRGVTFNQKLACELANFEHICLICGRYEGVDERVRELYVDFELSIGDYVLSGGEAAALVVVDAVGRLCKGVLGCESSSKEESFSQEHLLLEHPHYTRPRHFRGLNVPEVLLSGDHARIQKWRREEALKLTAIKRPELLEQAQLTEEDMAFLGKIR